MAAPRRKAADGLDKIPSSEGEWRAAVVKHGLQHRTLAQLCLNGRFSASTVPTDAFLTLRCIWLSRQRPGRALPYIINTGSFFNAKNAAWATTLTRNGCLGLDKLKMLYEFICISKIPKTPRQYDCTIADALGPFSMLVNLKRQLLDKSLHMPVVAAHTEVTGAPKSERFHDPTRLQSRDSPKSPTPKRLHPFDVEDVDMEDVGSQNLPPSAVPSPPASSGLDPTDEEPARRTPTETLVADFMVTLLAGMACFVQVLSPSPLCVANSYESTFQFGPVCGTGQQPGSDPVQFRARIDGSIPFSVSPSDKTPREAIIFEAKRAPRTDGDVSVLAQQSLEHISYIWERHKNERMPRPRRDSPHHTFMVAQDHLSFYISIGTYDNEYLDYIFSPTDVPIIPRSNAPFLRIQEFGPYPVDEDNRLALLLEIILSFLTWQLENTQAGSLIENAIAESKSQQAT
ncbi:hypothetical protein FQN54_005091 [Arachnomyces sp. PD_36]|nr:hypothetical protein FQN54_005091 [Arachnomyces sp. PD_36]